MAGFWNKLGKGLAAVSEGVASELPRVLARREREADRQLTRDRQDVRRDEARIWKQFETDPAGAIQAATTAGNAGLATTLKGIRDEGESTGRREQAGAVGTLAETAAQYTARIGSPEERSASIDKVRELQEGLRLGGGALETYAEGTYAGIGEPGQDALSKRDTALEYLTELEANLTKPDLILRGIDIYMPPEMITQRVAKWKEVMTGLGMDPSLADNRVVELRKGFQRRRDEAFKVLVDPYVMAHKYDEIRALAVEHRISHETELAMESLIAAEEQRISESVTERDRFETGQENLLKKQYQDKVRELSFIAHDPQLYMSEAERLISEMGEEGFPQMAESLRRTYRSKLEHFQSEGPDALARRIRQDYVTDPYKFGPLIPIYLEEPAANRTKGGMEYPSLEQLEKFIELQIKQMYPDYTPEKWGDMDEIEAIAESVAKNIGMGLDPDSILRALPEHKQVEVQRRVAEILAAQGQRGGLVRVAPGPGPTLADTQRRQQQEGTGAPLQSFPGPSVDIGGETLSSEERSMIGELALGSSARNPDSQRIGDELPFLPGKR